MTVVVDVFRVLSTCTSLVMLLSPVPAIVQILKTKSTGVASIVPLVSMFTNALIILMYGYVSEQYFPVFSTFAAGAMLSFTYICIFYRYTHEKAKAHKVFLIFGIPDLLVTIYALLGGFGVTNQSRHDVGQILGYLTIVTSALFYSSPLERISHVLKHRSAVFLNIHMIYAGTLNNAMWVVYSSLTGHWIIFGPNAFSLVSGCIQISLYWIFHPATHPLQTPTADEIKEVEHDLEIGPTMPSPTTGRFKGIDVDESPHFVLVASPLVTLQQQEKCQKV